MLAEVMMAEQELPSKKIKDMRGKKFGNGCIALAFLCSDKNNKIKWLCRCGCGQEFEAYGSFIRDGRTRNCKDCGRKRLYLSNTTNLIGLEFAETCVVKRYLGSDNNGPIWEAYCNKCCYSFKINSSVLRRKPKHCKNCRHNMIGKKFGQDCIILEKDEEKTRQNKRGQTYWFAECHCGFVWSIRRGHLKNIQQCDKCARAALAGNSHYNYNPNLTDEERKGRRGTESKRLKRKVLKRDNYTCQLTGIQDNLTVHHIQSWNNNPDLRFDVDNCITLSEDIHNLFHKTYGYGNNTKEQFGEFALSFKDTKYSGR